MTKKRYYIILFALTLICACNNINENKVNQKGQAVSGTISQEQQLKNLIALYPDSLLLIQNLIELYRNKGNYDTALIIANEAIKKDSLNVELWDILGILHYENGDTLKAINAYETAIYIYPLPEYIIALGTLYAQTKNPKALVMADALIVADKSNAKTEAMFIKGLYYTYISQKNKAITFFDSCLNNDYTYMFAYREKAIAFYDQAKYKDALRVLSRAVTIQNNFDEGYYWLGRCYEKLDSIAKAKENYQLALLYDKNFIEAKEALEELSKK
jgi:tetratricopeptide (TPR) repeat protein